MLEKVAETNDDSNGQEEAKSVKDQEVTATETDHPRTAETPDDVPSNDSRSTIEVPYSDKLNNKLNNKPDDLAEIIAIWPKLSEHIKAAIKALLQTHIKEQKQ